MMKLMNAEKYILLKSVVKSTSFIQFENKNYKMFIFNVSDAE